MFRLNLYNIIFRFLDSKNKNIIFETNKVP